MWKSSTLSSCQDQSMRQLEHTRTCTHGYQMLWIPSNLILFMRQETATMGTTIQLPTDTRMMIWVLFLVIYHRKYCSKGVLIHKHDGITGELTGCFKGQLHVEAKH